ncbi:hypothetical protein ABU162_30385 [Paenibacillus thiaminolyticus]|uniref:hypothetical protein n=1 Tax=Paenibacillus thiaminolyticus TaxID=49283 RepID=UPI0035A6BDFD
MAETVTYTGTALTVEFNYTKDTVDIPVKAVDYLTGAELDTSTVTGQRKGEAVTVGAPDVTDYVLVERLPPNDSHFCKWLCVNNSLASESSSI